MIDRDSVPLGDEQVQRYIADGFIVLDAGLPADFHAEVVDELHFAMQHETPLPGDNLLPRIPAMERLLSAPAVRGAMESLLGPDFAWAPHRFPHNSEPLANAKASADAEAICSTNPSTPSSAWPSTRSAARTPVARTRSGDCTGWWPTMSLRGVPR